MTDVAWSNKREWHVTDVLDGQVWGHETANCAADCVNVRSVRICSADDIFAGPGGSGVLAGDRLTDYRYLHVMVRR